MAGGQNVVIVIQVAGILIKRLGEMLVTVYMDKASISRSIQAVGVGREH